MAMKRPIVHFSLKLNSPSTVRPDISGSKCDGEKITKTKSSLICDFRVAQKLGLFLDKPDFSNSVFSLMVPHHIYLGMILKNSDYGLSWIMQRTLCTNTYQFHFFVLPMIFMPNPTVPYLCSQLASVTKGLCKQLLQANRFLPTSEETASYAAPICPLGMHKNRSTIFLFFLLVSTVHFRGRLRGKQRTGNRTAQNQMVSHPYTVVYVWAQPFSAFYWFYWNMATKQEGD